MTCERCGECRDGGMRFCAYCGEDLSDECPLCASQRESGALFCGECGRRLRTRPEPPAPVQSDVLRKATLLAVPVLLILLAIELVFMLAGTVDTWNWCASATMNILALVPHLVVVTTISGTPVQIAWILIEAAVLASVALVLIQTYRKLEGTRPDVDSAADTPLFRTAAVMAMGISMSYILAFLMLIAGVDLTTAGTPTGTVPEALLSYANAGVWEEVISRLVPIGIPMALVALAMRRRDCWRFLFGGFGMSRLSVALILISALMFGFAHMSGWGIWKIQPSFLMGILFGYLYVRVGIHASITVHFAVDYFAVVAYTGFEAVTVLSTLLILALLIIGLVAFGYYAKRIWENRESIRGMPGLMPPDQEISFSRRDED